MRSSRLVAESLRVMPQPIAAPLPPIRAADPAVIAQRWASAWDPQRADAIPPIWLRSDQHDSWRRAVAALERWDAALLADPVGSGKSWIALALAHHTGCHPVVIGPAVLAAQWHEVSRRAAVPITWHSHELLSRHLLPSVRSPLVIIDEAHRLRHLDTQRVGTLAPWLTGMRVALLTATPIVNRRADLFALLRLVLPDDALILDGIPSLRAGVRWHAPPRALRRLVIRSPPRDDAPPVEARRLPITEAEQARGAACAAGVAALRLSDEPGVRALLATVLLDAAASSDAAWRAALRRYRHLLLHAREAGALSRAALRHFAGASLEQTALWSLLGELEPVAPLPLDDLPRIEHLLAAPTEEDGWLAPLARLLADNQVTICFTRHRHTALAVSRALGRAAAWVTGEAAGIGPHRLARHQVLAAFGPSRTDWRLFRSTPTVLVCTEVLAEGLDLQGASRVVHLDLPWHPSRLEQRTGRVRRLGQLSPTVTEITRPIARDIEVRLGLARVVQRKARLADRWLAALGADPAAQRTTGDAVWYGVAPHSGGAEGLALVELASATRTGTIALILIDGIWQPAEVGDPVPIPPGALLAPTRLERRRAPAMVRRAAWRALELARRESRARPHLVGRLLDLARRARTARDHDTLARLDRLLDAAGREWPLGAERSLDLLERASDRELLAAEVAPSPGLPPPRVTSLTLLHYRREDSALR